MLKCIRAVRGGLRFNRCYVGPGRVVASELESSVVDVSRRHVELARLSLVSCSVHVLPVSVWRVLY